MLDWGLTAAALLLFLYAVRASWVAQREGKESGLGCGFGVVACALWAWVLRRHLDDPWPAVRIALGVLLVLPAVGALARPKGAKILQAALALVLAVVLAGPPLVEVWHRYGPDPRSARERELDDAVAEFETLRGDLELRHDALETLRGEERAALQAAGKSWDEVRADPDALQHLALLQRIDAELAAVRDDLAQVEAHLVDLRAARERGEPEAAISKEEAQLQALRASLRDATPLDELGVVEKHALEAELHDLYDSEF
ncbi:MAG: hypothetical protein H6828_09305 [Planctomycetes bacterium]|nr:hypothetical protein [Planctomycetota bacterium]